MPSSEWLSSDRSRGLALLLLAALLAFAFQGSRALWEPDEGRYANVALNILSSGDWVSLYRHHESLHFTKPPLTYWAMATSVLALGANEWALRLPGALAFLACAAMLLHLGRILVPRRPWLPALVYITSPVPVLAAFHISTDTMLAATETLAVLCYIKARFGGGGSRWLDGMWLGFGLAFLTKGPPGLLPLLAIVVFEAWQGAPRKLWRPWGLAAFAIVGLGWYLAVVLRHPGLLDYFLGHELYDRVATATHRRSPEWYGAFLVYGPTFLLGALPWLAAGLRPRSEWRQWRQGDAITRFLWLWLLLPLLVFCLSRSRLPLYVLPLFVPLSLLLGRALQDMAWSRPRLAGLALWVVALLAIKGALAGHETKKDSRVFAAELQALLPWRPGEVVFVEDFTRYGLRLYLDTQIEKISFKPHVKRISDNEFDNDLATELSEVELRRVFIVQRDYGRYFDDSLHAAGRDARELGRIGDRTVFVLESDLVADPQPATP